MLIFEKEYEQRVYVWDRGVLVAILFNLNGLEWVLDSLVDGNCLHPDELEQILDKLKELNGVK